MVHRGQREHGRGSPVKPKQVLVGSQFNEPMRVETVTQAGNGTWTLGLVGTKTDRFRSVILTDDDIASLTVQDAACSYAGDGELLRLGLQAYALGIAYEFDLISAFRSRASIHCRINSKRSTTICSSWPESDSCSPTTRARARRSWPGCFCVT